VKKIVLLCTTALVPSAAFAQSTGQVETEKDAIIITATKTDKGIAGVVIQDSTKAKGLVTQEFISKQNPGQTIINNINFVPGATFTQNDPYGSSGGNIRIRGFDGNRVSVTFDGVPLNDSGNYAVYTNQILDPELVEQMNVNLGATDVDSPTASAAGGTINFRSLVPSKTAGARLDASYGSFNFRRVFGLAQTGEIGPWGTRMWVAGSVNKYDHWRGPGKIDKWQINARIYQPIGHHGDFISLAGHYNQNRNDNYNNPNLTDLRTLFGKTVVPDLLPSDGFVKVGDYDSSEWSVIDHIAYAKDCKRATPVNGTAQVDSSSCSNSLGVQINPSNTGNIREQSRFTLAPGLVLTADGYYQYVLADGGGQSTVLSEKDVLLTQGVAGSTGVDLNGDGDTLDRVLVGRPSITNTNRFTGIASLVWKPDSHNTFRVAYTYDRAHHRQTGEYSPTDLFSNVGDPFFGRNGTPIITAAGTKLQNRDRTSIALLNQLSAQYIGRYVDDRLRVELGVRSPWFKRDLDQHCYTPLTGSGFPLCIENPLGAGYTIRPVDYDPATAGSKDLWAPFKASYKYHKILPNIGATFALTDAVSIFGSYAKGLSAPRTDNLYRQPVIKVTPETTDSFDLGARYVNREFQAQATAWKINYQNRIVTSYDPETNTSIDRNVGKVKSWGVDSSVGYRPIRQLNLLALASYTSAKLQEDLLLGRFTYNTASPTVLPSTLYYCSPLPTSGSGAVDYCARTAGKFVVETPKWQFGGRAEVDLKAVTFGVQVKYVGDRWATDVNDVKSKGYTLVDLDARVRMGGVLKKTYLQLNVTNLFNEHYFGNLSTSINAFGPIGQFAPSQPRFTPGGPRTISGTINVEF
jgi:iron complex outermembrane receptor protein